MIRQLESDRTLHDLTRLLVDALHPDRIILFGSRARGDAREDSDYDIALELDAPDSRDLRNVIRNVAGGTAVHVHLRQPGEVETKRNDPGYMDWDIARDGIVLYSAPGRSSRVREGLPPPSCVTAWRDRAQIDLLTVDACLAFQTVPWASVCFHAQQAAEKYLKAAIVSAGVRPKRTHRLDDLMSQRRETGALLPDLQGECDALSKYAVDVRYPDDVKMATSDDGLRAVEAMRTIIAALPT